MAVPLASTPIVDHPRRTGRLTNEEREERTAPGRAIHWFEDRLMEIQRFLSHLFGAHERETLIDAELDGKVRLAIVRLDAGDGLEARALLLEYLERDAIRDAEHRAQGEHATNLHGVVRRIGAALERAAVSVRGGR